MRRHFQYNEQDRGVVNITDEEILATYFDDWQGQLRKLGRDHMISPEHCIEDFCAVHWAWEVTPGEED